MIRTGSSFQDVGAIGTYSVSATLTEAQKLALKAEGFLLWEADAAPYAEGMTIYRLNTTTRRLLDKAESDRTLLFTPNTVTADALPTICGYLTELHYTVRPVNDWTLPF